MHASHKAFLEPKALQHICKHAKPGGECNFCLGEKDGNVALQIFKCERETGEKAVEKTFLFRMKTCFDLCLTNYTR